AAGETGVGGAWPASPAAFDSLSDGRSRKCALATLFFPHMSESVIRIVNARQHNLRGVTVDLPHRSLIVVTGPSGSGKSSLAFDTLYTQGQRRNIQSTPT